MLALLYHLEVRRFYPHKIIYKELEECQEIYFVMKGLYSVGFEINKIMKYRLQFSPRTAIGGFNMQFGKRMLFIFKADTELDCLSIRKKNFFNLTN